MIKLKSLFRRGHGSPSSTGSSSSKNNQQQISSVHSASASSLDRIPAPIQSGSASVDLGASRKLSKQQKQSSKDKLNDLLRVGSKEKIIDDKKELKKQQKLQQKQQMQQIAQQSANVQYQQQPSMAVPASSGHLATATATTTSVVSHSHNHHSGRSKDFEVVSYDDAQDVSF